MIKTIFKGFLLLFIPIIWVVLYFYIFPVYSDHNISEEIFHTRFHNEWFDSPRNGFDTWKELLEWLETHQSIIQEFDIYYRCYVINDCSFIAPDMSLEAKSIYLSELLDDTDTFKSFTILVSDFMMDIDSLVSNYDYISALNYMSSTESTVALWPEIVATHNLRAFIRWMLFYIEHLPRAEANALLISYYKFLSWLSFSLDDGMVVYLNLFEMFEELFSYYETYISSLNPVFQRMHLSILEQHEISSDMIENAIKVDYNYQYEIFDALENHDIWIYDAWLNTRMFFFYNKNDSINILQKIFSEILERNCQWEIQLNGRNYVGRTLLNMIDCNIFSAHFLKQEEVLYKRQKLIDTFSS